MAIFIINNGLSGVYDSDKLKSDLNILYACVHPSKQSAGPHREEGCVFFLANNIYSSPLSVRLAGWPQRPDNSYNMFGSSAKERNSACFDLISLLL